MGMFPLPWKIFLCKRILEGWRVYFIRPWRLLQFQFLFHNVFWYLYITELFGVWPFPKKGMSSPSASTVNTLLKFLRKVWAFSCSFFVKIGSSSSSSDITRSGMPVRVVSLDCAYLQNALGLALVFCFCNFFLNNSFRFSRKAPDLIP